MTKIHEYKLFSILSYANLPVASRHRLVKCHLRLKLDALRGTHLHDLALDEVLDHGRKQLDDWQRADASASIRSPASTVSLLPRAATKSHDAAALLYHCNSLEHKSGRSTSFSVATERICGEANSASCFEESALATRTRSRRREGASSFRSRKASGA